MLAMPAWLSSVASHFKASIKVQCDIVLGTIEVRL